MRVPRGFDPAAVIPGESRRYDNPTSWFVHKVTVGPLFDARTRGERRGWHPVKYEDMSPMFGKEGAWSRVRRQLIAEGVVECDETYRPGEKAKYYRLGPAWLARDTERRPITDARFLRRVEAREETREAVSEALKPIHDFLKASLEELTIDEKATRRFTTNPLSLGHRFNRLAVDAIRDGEWKLTACPYGRVHTNITNMSRKIRSALRWHGASITEVDVVNAQPILIGAMASAWSKGMTSIETIREAGRKAEGKGKERASGGDNTPVPYVPPFSRNLHNPAGDLLPRGGLDDPREDVRDYIETCESGRFYETLAGLWCLDVRDDAQRHRLKRAAFKLVLFGPTRPTHPKWLEFKLRWPTVAAFLELAKAPDERIKNPSKADKKAAYGVPARASQRVESDLMIAGVAGRLMAEHPGTPIWTIHDSVLVAPHAAEAVARTIAEVFAGHGLRPRIKVKAS